MLQSCTIVVSSELRLNHSLEEQRGLNPRMTESSFLLLQYHVHSIILLITYVAIIYIDMFVVVKYTFQFIMFLTIVIEYMFYMAVLVNQWKD